MKTKLSARLNRVRFIDRWPLMATNLPEDVSQHIYECNTITLLLALIDKRVFNKPTDPYKAVAISQTHEAEEALLTGDINSVAKNSSTKFKEAYTEIKNEVLNQLIEDAPETIRQDIADLVRPKASREKDLAKAADVIQAFIKAKTEVLSHNEREFSDAAKSLSQWVDNAASNDPTIKHFLDYYIDAHFASVDVLLVNELNLAQE